MLPSVKKSISCCLSNQNPATYLFRAVLSCKRCLICADFSPDSDQNTFSLRKHYYGLWTQILVKNFLMMDLFQLLSSPDVNWWTGVLWITCVEYNGVELWCFYQLFGLSFWWHPFTAEHPLWSKWCNATFLQIWWKYKLIILDGLRVRKCSVYLSKSLPSRNNWDIKAISWYLFPEGSVLFCSVLYL